MIQSISKNQFADAFRTYGREDQFSYDGLNALYDYLEGYEELDVIALCCEYTEYESADEAASNYFEYEGMEYDEDGSEVDTPEEVEEKALSFLQDRTTVIIFGNGIIIMDF